jgi:hypothetical protein
VILKARILLEADQAEGSPGLAGRCDRRGKLDFSEKWCPFYRISP